VPLAGQISLEGIICQVILGFRWRAIIISRRLWLGDVASVLNDMNAGHRYVQEFVEEGILLSAGYWELGWASIYR